MPLIPGEGLVQGLVHMSLILLGPPSPPPLFMGDSAPVVATACTLLLIISNLPGEAGS